MRYSPKKAFSIVFAMWFVLLTSLISIYVLSFIIPFGKSVKGIEFSTSSYYNAYAGVEEAMYLYGSGAQNKQYGYEDQKLITGTQDFWYDIASLGTQIPISWEWNSEYDTDWNRISSSEPIQLFIGNNLLSASMTGITTIRFRTPDISGSGRPTLAWSSGSWAILWQISSIAETLYPRDSAFITIWNINSVTNVWANFWSKQWQQIDGTTYLSAASFYGANCNGTKSCSLKLSIIGDLVDTSGKNIPYLEYQIVTSSPIPLRFSKILAEGNYNGYAKTLEVNIPQQTLNQAFDFTVFQ